MADLILSVYESKYPVRMSGRLDWHWFDVFMMLLVSVFLIYDLRYGKNAVLQVVLCIFYMAVLFYLRFRMRKKDRKSVENYSMEMEQMEDVLFHLDIDTYSKLELVIDEVKDRIEYEEKGYDRYNRIRNMGILAAAIAFGVSCICMKDAGSYMQPGGAANLFFVLAIVTLCVFYCLSGILSREQKYRWLYNMLLNVRITKF